MVETRKQKAAASCDDNMKTLISVLQPSRKFSDGSVFPPHSDGVSIVNLHFIFGEVIDAATKLLEDKYRDKKVKPIFNTKYREGDKGIQRRSQRVFTDKEIKTNPFLSAVKDQMIYHAKTINSKYNYLYQMQLLISDKGCAKQVLHTDGHGKTSPFLSSIFSLEDNTSIYFSERKVTVDKCNLVTFHSSTMHGGAEYLKKSNIRIHAYLGTEDVTKFPKDSIGEVEDIFECKYCECMFDVKSKRNEHQRTCKQRPDYEKVIEKRRNRNKNRKKRKKEE